MLKPLSIERFERPVGELAAGPAPQLQWVEVKDLAVDGSYQREISSRGATNVRRIAEHFDWSKFAPVIVAPVEGGMYAIVDGQHRTTAALLRGMTKVPCQIVQADRAKQAEAFAAVNGNITRTTPTQIYHARLAAGDPKAAAITEVCAAAGVTVMRRNIIRERAKVGQTQAIGALLRCFEVYGRDTLITALQCITQTGDGNPGYVRAMIIEALCKVLTDEPRWRDAGEALLKALDDFDFAEAWDQTVAGRQIVMSEGAILGFAERVRMHLNQKNAETSSVGAPKSPKRTVLTPSQRAVAAT